MRLPVDPLPALRQVSHRVRVPFGVYNLRPVTTTTRPGTGVYRSALLWGATPADFKRLGELGIREVIDLRTAKVAANFPDPLVPGVELRTDIDIHGDEDEVPARRETAEDVVAIMEQRYRNFVVLPGQRERIGRALRAIAAQPGAVLFHCTDGKDRTGWIAALLQHVHGDPMAIIFDSYLQSNRHVHGMRRFRRVTTSLLKGKSAAVRNDPSNRVQPSFLQAALDEVAARYGDLDGYLREGLGLDEQTLDALRAKL